MTLFSKFSGTAVKDEPKDLGYLIDDRRMTEIFNRPLTDIQYAEFQKKSENGSEPVKGK